MARADWKPKLAGPGAGRRLQGLEQKRRRPQHPPGPGWPCAYSVKLFNAKSEERPRE